MFTYLVFDNGVPSITTGSSELVFLKGIKTFLIDSKFASTIASRFKLSDDGLSYIDQHPELDDQEVIQLTINQAVVDSYVTSVDVCSEAEINGEITLSVSTIKNSDPLQTVDAPSLSGKAVFIPIIDTGTGRLVKMVKVLLTGGTGVQTFTINSPGFYAIDKVMIKPNTLQFEFVNSEITVY